MYCTKCGVEQDNVARYCSQCGTATANASTSAGTAETPYQNPNHGAAYMPYKPLLRSRNGRWIGGVCSGLAKYWDMDPIIVRVLFVALALCPVLPAIIPYIVCWIIIPQERLELAPAPVLQRV